MQSHLGEASNVFKEGFLATFLSLDVYNVLGNIPISFNIIGNGVEDNIKASNKLSAVMAWRVTTSWSEHTAK